MFAKTRGTTKAALLALVAAVLLAGTAVSDADAQGLTWQQLQAQGWTCVTPPVGPAATACFNPACCSVRRAMFSSASTSSAPTSTTASGAGPSPTSSAR